MPDSIVHSTPQLSQTRVLRSYARPCKNTALHKRCPLVTTPYMELTPVATPLKRWLFYKSRKASCSLAFRALNKLRPPLVWHLRSPLCNFDLSFGIFGLFDCTFDLRFGFSILECLFWGLGRRGLAGCIELFKTKRYSCFFDVVYVGDFCVLSDRLDCWLTGRFTDRACVSVNWIA